MRLIAPVGAEVAVDDAVVAAFALVEDLEQKLSKFREISDVARFNQASVGGSVPVSAEFCELLELATKLWHASEGAFDPFSGTPEVPVTIEHSGNQPFARRTLDYALDLSGIAKGYIVDKAIGLLSDRGLSGVVNAGGDMRFFNAQERTVEIRLLGQPGTFRRVQLNQDALATSSFSEAIGNPRSNTRYSQTPRFDEFHSVSAIAAAGVIADALTKVAWFAPPALAQEVAKQFNARYLIFDREGEEVPL